LNLLLEMLLDARSRQLPRSMASGGGAAAAH
jgi:hypothetical protein